MKPFPKLYQSHDDVDNQPCLRIDDAVGRRVLNVTLSGYMPGVEPSPAEWAAHVERACNNHERLVDALRKILYCAEHGDTSNPRAANLDFDQIEEFANAALKELDQ